MFNKKYKFILTIVGQCGRNEIEHSVLPQRGDLIGFNGQYTVINIMHDFDLNCIWVQCKSNEKIAKEITKKHTSK